MENLIKKYSLGYNLDGNGLNEMTSNDIVLLINEVLIKHKGMIITDIELIRGNYIAIVKIGVQKFQIGGGSLDFAMFLQKQFEIAVDNIFKLEKL